uniref:Uncharacterized protein n=1 Tax=Chromera velia CCMP2878 TaxID=1169474 RepID=A0A0G4GQQ3_9ALVE|eukprot:Cvel_22953.t1-p1 / transcript=Cvel_22953.t1 / gene=Cvel_22953 / organism=Chromera_velia_CCMP2878 / gene_product=hypothetical protein / transcript_product=hypothetical protein / location=Cvel_scaffold2312:12641-14595(-) / protein_length=424 / sequence_SO=supercontig / SO=protein_coding / is_pseudo=false
MGLQRLCRLCILAVFISLSVLFRFSTGLQFQRREARLSEGVCNECGDLLDSLLRSGTVGAFDLEWFYDGSREAINQRRAYINNTPGLKEKFDACVATCTPFKSPYMKQSHAVYSLASTLLNGDAIDAGKKRTKRAEMISTCEASTKTTCPSLCPTMVDNMLGAVLQYKQESIARIGNGKRVIKGLQDERKEAPGGICIGGEVGGCLSCSDLKSFVNTKEVIQKTVIQPIVASMQEAFEAIAFKGLKAGEEDGVTIDTKKSQMAQFTERMTKVNALIAKAKTGFEKAQTDMPDIFVSLVGSYGTKMAAEKEDRKNEVWRPLAVKRLTVLRKLVEASLGDNLKKVKFAEFICDANGMKSVARVEMKKPELADEASNAVSTLSLEKPPEGVSVDPKTGAASVQRGKTKVDKQVVRLSQASCSSFDWA